MAGEQSSHLQPEHCKRLTPKPGLWLWLCGRHLLAGMLLARCGDNWISPALLCMADNVYSVWLLLAVTCREYCWTTWWLLWQMLMQLTMRLAVLEPCQCSVCWTHQVCGNKLSRCAALVVETG
jgi:hypothetical protein